MYVLLSACVYANAQDQHRCAGTDADVDTRAYPHPRAPLPALVSLTLAVARSTNVYIYIYMGKILLLACLLRVKVQRAGPAPRRHPLSNVSESRGFGALWTAVQPWGVGVGGSVRSL